MGERRAPRAQVAEVLKTATHASAQLVAKAFRCHGLMSFVREWIAAGG